MNYNNLTAPNGTYRFGSIEDNNTSEHIIIAINTVFAIFGAFGNISAVIVLAFGKHNANPRNVLLLNLAISDLGVLLISFPVWAVKILMPFNWPFGKVMCKVLSASMDLFHVVSLATNVVIAIVRYKTIVHTIESRNWATKHIKFIVVLIWIFCFCTASIPQMISQKFYKQNFTYHNATNFMYFCVDKRDGLFNKVEALIGTFVWYLIPLLITLVTFVKIHLFLNKHVRQIEINQSEAQSSIHSRIKSYHKVSRMLGAVVISFALLMLPWNVIKLLIFLFDMQIEQVYLHVAGTLLILNSCLNPIIYYMMASEFRAEFKRKIITFKMRVCKTLLRCNLTSRRQSADKLLFVCASRRQSDLFEDDCESTSIAMLRDTRHRKQSMMQGDMKHNIDDVVSTLKRENSRLEETLI